MDNNIKSYTTLSNLVEIDDKDHKQKDIATLFLCAMNDWPTYNQTEIQDFIHELKAYFGTPLTIKKIQKIKFDGQNAWQVESGNSIAELMDISTRFCNQTDFDIIIDTALSYYEEEFRKVDFIAKLRYFTTEQGGRITPVSSGYRPIVKFDFSESQISGQQTFIDKELVYPGDTVDARIKLSTTDYFANALTEGMNFEFSEGSSIIGTGQIIIIVNDKLEQINSW